MVLGILLTMVVVIVAPKYLKSDGDGFFRPQPNPDAQPVPVAGEDAVAPEGELPAPKARKGKDEGQDSDEYDFYTLLPGKEVPLSDAEIAATERAEAQREAARQKQQADAQSSDDADVTAAPAPLPKPVDDGVPAKPVATPAAITATSSSKPASTGAAVSTTPAIDDDTRYLLQAGAFQASGQAEELKAKIALLGLGARVESAQISGKTVYRVRMGPYGTATDLAEAKRKLSAGGLQAMAVRVK